MKSVRMTEPKQMATSIALGGITTAFGLKEKVSPHEWNWKSLQENLLYKVKSLWRHF